MKYLAHLIAAACLVSSSFAGPFPPAAGQPGSDAVAASDSRFKSWASSAVVQRGPTEIGYAGSSLATYGTDASATGRADATPDSPYPVVSLGDGGIATLKFAKPIADGPGADFAVFENGFSSAFLELAHVEVSSNGVNFFRFPSVSLTASSGVPGEGGSVDPTNVRNLAGKYTAGFGTPFDLAELRNVSPLLDVQRITDVRIIDAVGTNDPAYASRDSLGNIVIDPYPTAYPTGGFDLDAVGALTTTPTTYAAWKTLWGSTSTDLSADTNLDGVPDFVEYLTGTGRIEIGVTSTVVTLRFQRLSYRTDGNLRLEGSPDLVNWTKLAESLHGAAMTASVSGALVSESGNSAKRTTVTVPASAGWNYFRLAAEP